MMVYGPTGTLSPLWAIKWTQINVKFEKIKEKRKES